LCQDGDNKRETKMVKAIVAVVVYATYRVRAAVTKSRAERFRLWSECDKTLARLAK
jgi:hypothetical protein